VTPVEALVRERIAREGPLSFVEVMRLALYHPEHGYYTALRGFGAEGDFMTSPELHPMFGHLLAREAAHVWAALGQPEPFRILELGAGSGALAASMLEALPMPVDYAVDEPSTGLRRRLSARGLSIADTQGQYGLVVANEVLDAQPVHRVTVRDGKLRELLVHVDGAGRLAWLEADSAPLAVERYFGRLELLPPDGATAEVNTGLREWTQALANWSARGVAIILDYGYTAEALFARQQGTLLTYWRHTLGSDPLVRLGEQDISTHVDFSTLAMAARDAGFEVVGVTSQRALLRTLGIEQLELRSPAERRAVMQLTDPNGLGRIGVLFLSRGLPAYQPLGLHAAPP
jgi:SAM-dependent MidA family methyltransferase